MAKKKKKGESVATPPNLLLIITDQQRYPMHWPEDQEWLDDLMPADAELARTGVTFEETSIASCMCSPSRASLFTGRWPAEHGVDLTLTRGGAVINREHSKHALRKGIDSVRSGEINQSRDFPIPEGGRSTRFGKSVTVVFTVTVDGRARNCSVANSQVDAETTALVCPLVIERIRFNPATTAEGTPVEARYGYRVDFRAR